MATYASLTTEQKAIVQAWQTLQASWAAAQAKANDLGQQVDSTYNNQVSPLSLANTEVIPLSNNYAGAQSLTYGQAVTIESYIQGINTNYNTTAIRGVMVLACGAANL